MINKILEKISANWIFCILVIILYFIVGIFKFELINSSFLIFINIIIQILPTLLLVFIFVFLFNLFFDTKKIVKLLGHGSGIKGWIIAIFGGILSSGPIYMWYPLLQDLKKQGMKNSLITAFLYNRAVKIPLMPLMIYYFGWLFLIVLTFYMIIFSIINGLIVGKFTRR